MKKLIKLECALISQRALFKKVAIVPKGRFPKPKGSICNMPINRNEITNILPHVADSNGLVTVKWKRKLGTRGHVYFEGVYPESINQTLLYLVKYNHLYQNVTINIQNTTINMNNIAGNLKYLKDPSTGNFHELFDLEENVNPQINYKCSAQESVSHL